MDATKYQEIKLSKLRNADWNYKIEDDELLDKLVQNIRKNGQIENIIVRSVGKQFEVVNGNHRLTAMKQLGIETAMCYNLGKISLPAAKRIAIETNETKFDSNIEDLAEILKELSGEYEMNDLMETMPFTEGEIHNLADMIDYSEPDYDIETLPGGEKNYEAKLVVEYNFEDGALVDEVAKLIKKYPSAVLK